MSNSIQAGSNQKTTNQQDDDRRSGWRIAGLIGSLIILLGIIIAALRIASRYFASTSDPIAFITANLVNALIFIAIVAQVLIYRKQRDIMEQQRRTMVDQLEIADQGRRMLELQLVLSGLQADAMQRQSNALRESLAQNERAMIAAEQNTAIAKEAFYVGEAPYFGTSRIAFHRAGEPDGVGGTDVSRWAFSNSTTDDGM